MADNERDNSTAYVVGGGVVGVAILLWLLGRGPGKGEGQGPDHGGTPPPLGSTAPASERIELWAAGQTIKTKAGLVVWGIIGDGYGWLADPNTILKNKHEIWLHPDKGVQESVDAFKQWVSEQTAPLVLFEIED